MVSVKEEDTNGNGYGCALRCLRCKAVAAYLSFTYTNRKPQILHGQQRKDTRAYNLNKLSCMELPVSPGTWFVSAYYTSGCLSSPLSRPMTWRNDVVRQVFVLNCIKLIIYYLYDDIQKCLWSTWLALRTESGFWGWSDDEAGCLASSLSASMGLNWH